MEEKLELRRQEINKVTQPIFARLEHYRKVMFEIRKLLKEYFFNEGRTQKLTEVARADEQVFSFNMVRDAMEKCLVDEQTLVETAEAIMYSAENARLVTAFDSHVLASGLPLEFHKQDGIYLFKPEKSYTPEAQAFMRQFACALGAYRVCLGICEIYFAIYQHQSIQTGQLQNYIDSACHLKQQLNEEVDLIFLHKQVKTIKKEITSLLRVEKVHEGLNQFEYDIDLLTKRLVELLESGAVHLQNCYKEFPNNPILWMLHDRSWHALLKTLSGLLYAEQYTYSTLYGTLEIKKEFTCLIKTEIDQFAVVNLAQLPLLKIELLKKAAKLITETKIDILAKLAEQGVELIEAPKTGMFSPPLSNSIYGLMLAYHQRQLTGLNATEDEFENDDEFNQDFKSLNNYL
ncbi:hypothetical protein [Fluoribacter gormanii]|uniref:Coiled-coil protein n=1 Tax=Fluoribacter gormanii TaxID=464 RepID=A0A377GMY6_9GAMM|nr:hypothetical protein [Fluoribacter gormanii]KTD02459.1 coiled-coil protein [Fluoribacter gormanii]MCW8445494.1 hypothetical protein [Fluoribacter gormanii]SIR92872.1 hypothetical protein SAMN05421777_1481 [Fluoribacter gormanii]STO26138.1 Uncharacterised protein [Fluoribacter gormanii]